MYIVLVIGRCEHDILTGPPTDADRNQLKYFSRSEKSFRVLQKLVMDEKWLQSMKYYTKFRFVELSSIASINRYFRHTGKLKSFHNLALAYTPKRTAFQ